MNEERMKILEMLANGQIGVEEAQQLLEAIEPNASPPWPVEAIKSGRKEQLVDSLTGTGRAEQKAAERRHAPADVIDKMMALRIHGVDAPFVNELRALGLANLGPDQLLAMRIHDVTPEYVRAMRAAGFDDLTTDQLVAFRIHHVTPEYAAELRAAGLGNVTPDQLVAMRIHGVTADFIEQMHAEGFPELTADQLVAMRIHGVQPAFFREMHELGLLGGDEKAA
jgi:hypothetical protein